MWENLILLSQKFWWDFRNLISYPGNNSPWERLTQDLFSLKQNILSPLTVLNFTSQEPRIWSCQVLALCTHIPASCKTCVMKKLVTKCCSSTLKLKMFFLIIMYLVPSTGMSFYWWWWTVITWNTEMKEVTRKEFSPYMTENPAAWKTKTKKTEQVVSTNPNGFPQE